MSDSYDKCSQILLKLQKCMDKLKDNRRKKIMSHEHRKILKLFNYTEWTEYMKWVNQKLIESGQPATLSEIVQEEQEDSMPQPNTNICTEELETEVLAIKNAKLRRENLMLEKAIQDLKTQLLIKS